MDLKIDRNYLINTFRELVSTPSPVGYYVKLNPVIEKLAKELSLEVTYDNRSTAYIALDGEDNTKTVLVSAHADTNGFSVRNINSDGTLNIRILGGFNMSSIEGETVRVHTRDGREYTGLAICKYHSTHVFEECHTAKRDVDTIRILLDENVKSKDDVHELGIRNGDFISVEPHTEFTDNGYIKSRFIDDKGGIACVFAALKEMKEKALKPKYRTLLAFPYYEEIGMGGAYVPPEVEEYIAIDIGLIGPELDGHERAVSICAKDATAPYNFELTNRLISQAERLACDYSVDSYFRYSTDANAAFRAGNNIRQASFGTAAYCTHGRERTHIDGLEATSKLILGYILDI